MFLLEDGFLSILYGALNIVLLAFAIYRLLLIRVPLLCFTFFLVNSLASHAMMLFGLTHFWDGRQWLLTAIELCAVGELALVLTYHLSPRAGMLLVYRWVLLGVGVTCFAMWFNPTYPGISDAEYRIGIAGYLMGTMVMIAGVMHQDGWGTPVFRELAGGMALWLGANAATVWIKDREMIWFVAHACKLAAHAGACVLWIGALTPDPKRRYPLRCV